MSNMRPHFTRQFKDDLPFYGIYLFICRESSKLSYGFKQTYVEYTELTAGIGITGF
jgi:hypothetical protein